MSQGKLLVGQETDCHVRIESVFVSRYHCALALDDIALQVRDLGSKNGTYVNGRRIGRTESVLVHGDLFTVGDITFQISIAPPLQENGSNLSRDGSIRNPGSEFLPSVPRNPFAGRPLCMQLPGTGTTHCGIDCELKEEDGISEEREKHDGDVLFRLPEGRI